MKTAISVPDEVFASAELLAKKLKVSRSELYRRALGEFLARHAPQEVTDSWNAVIDEVGQPAGDHTAAARAVFERVKW